MTFRQILHVTTAAYIVGIPWGRVFSRFNTWSVAGCAILQDKFTGEMVFPEPEPPPRYLKAGNSASPRIVE